MIIKFIQYLSNTLTGLISKNKIILPSCPHTFFLKNYWGEIINYSMTKISFGDHILNLYDLRG